MTFWLFIELKIAQHWRKAAETRHTSERNRLRMGCKPIYLRAIPLTQSQMQSRRFVYMNRSETLHLIRSDIASVIAVAVAVASLGVNGP